MKDFEKYRLIKRINYWLNRHGNRDITTRMLPGNFEPVKPDQNKPISAVSMAVVVCRFLFQLPSHRMLT